MLALIEEAVDEATLFFWRAVKEFSRPFSIALRDIRQSMVSSGPTILLISDHLGTMGYAEVALRRVGRCVAHTKRKKAQMCLEQEHIDLIVVYLSLGMDNHHKKNEALPFARWLAKRNGQCPPSVVLMRGYGQRQEELPFRVTDVQFLPFQGGQGEDWEASLPTIRRAALPKLVSWRLAHSGAR